MTHNRRWQSSLLSLVLLGQGFSLIGYAQQVNPPGVIPGVPSTYPTPTGAPRTEPIRIERKTETVKPEERVAREEARRQYVKKLRELGQISAALLQEHQSGRLTSTQLEKDVKAVGQRARSVRSSWLYGKKSPPESEINEKLVSAADYDLALRALAKLANDFLNNPAITNRTTLDLNEVKRAETDLGSIIFLCKMIEEKAKGYSAIH